MKIKVSDEKLEEFLALLSDQDVQLLNDYGVEVDEEAFDSGEEFEEWFIDNISPKLEEAMLINNETKEG